MSLRNEFFPWEERGLIEELTYSQQSSWGITPLANHAYTAQTLGKFANQSKK